MTSSWKKMAMIMLAGLLIAGPIVPPHAVAQSDTGAWDRTMGGARAAMQRATKSYNGLMSSMKSMTGMPMTDNEKAMMKPMQMTADTVKSLMDTNRQLIELLNMSHKQ